MLLRCTGRLLAAVGGSTKLVGNLDATPSGGDFYANLIWIERRKCLLITHAATLFSVFVPDIRVSDLRPIGPLVISSVQAALETEGLAAETFGCLDGDEVELAKTASRSILGCMNDLTLHIHWAVLDAGGLSFVDVRRLNGELHRTILSPLGNSHPIERAMNWQVVEPQARHLSQSVIDDAMGR
jgi:hypothetical protein